MFHLEKMGQKYRSNKNYNFRNLLHCAVIFASKLPFGVWGVSRRGKGGELHDSSSNTGGKMELLCIVS